MRSTRVELGCGCRLLPVVIVVRDDVGNGVGVLVDVSVELHCCDPRLIDASRIATEVTALVALILIDDGVVHGHQLGLKG